MSCSPRLAISASPRASYISPWLRSARRIERTQLYAQGLVWIEDLDFSNGVIEAEIAGALAPGAGGEARGFVGIAFRVQEDLETYDAFYLRPMNGRAEDQERRNHSAQYISLPEWPWFRLRKETPSKYEAYVDLVPGAWTKIKIEVRGERARSLGAVVHVGCESTDGSGRAPDLP